MFIVEVVNRGETYYYGYESQELMNNGIEKILQNNNNGCTDYLETGSISFKRWADMPRSERAVEWERLAISQ